MGYPWSRGVVNPSANIRESKPAFILSYAIANKLPMRSFRAGKPRSLILSAALLFAAPMVPAQTPTDSAIAATPDYQPLRVDRGTAALQQSLRKLATRASLMMIVAHPDDEDGGMLTYESRGQGARVALLTLNRGEGGQNIMSNDLWDQLALVRTQELLSRRPPLRGRSILHPRRRLRLSPRPSTRRSTSGDTTASSMM